MCRAIHWNRTIRTVLLTPFTVTSDRSVVGLLGICSNITDKIFRTRIDDQPIFICVLHSANVLYSPLGLFMSSPSVVFIIPVDCKV